MATYKSKVGLEIVIPISVIVGGTGILMAYEKIWLGFAIILLVAVFIIHMFAKTYYQIDDRTLKIKCGFFYAQSININTIKEIKETNTPISSPATSLDRIIVRYNKFDNIIISPVDKESFINHLATINPNIKLILKDNETMVQ